LQYLFVSWERLEELLARLASSIKKRGFKPDIIVGVSRGGLVPTRLISDFLNIKDVVVLGVAFYEDLGKTSNEPRITHPLSRDIRGKKVLLLDDVSDTGGSLELAKEHVLSFKPADLLVCTLHRKPWSTFRPDIYVEETDRWIIYPWEKVEAGIHILSHLKAGQDRATALSDLGFSKGDIRLLGDLEVLDLEPDLLGRNDDDTECR